jgi:CBS domain-containing protein
MRISDIIRHKGSDVATITPADSVRGLLARLAERNVGALVVVDGESVVGIVSERDVVRRLHSEGDAVLSANVGSLMTSMVRSTTLNESIDSVAEAMTEQRIRHMPVLSDGKLVGIVSIGDVVAARMRQLEADRGQLERYITQGR